MSTAELAALRDFCDGRCAQMIAVELTELENCYNRPRSSQESPARLAATVSQLGD
jgi:hypothetical protein